MTLIILENLSSINPGPFFVLSLAPYLVFLYFAEKSKLIPSIALTGFKLTLLFVFMTIIFSIIAKLKYGSELTNIDALHGSAESFLAIADALIVFGFFTFLQEKQKNK